MTEFTMEHFRKYQAEANSAREEGIAKMKEILKKDYPEINLDDYRFAADEWEMTVYLSTEEVIEINRMDNFAVKLRTAFGFELDWTKENGKPYMVTENNGALLLITWYDENSTSANVRRYNTHTGHRYRNNKPYRVIKETNKGRYVSDSGKRIYLWDAE